MPHMEVIWDKRNRTPVLALSGALICVTALVDWWTKPYFSLGFLYLFPVMLMAGFLPRPLVALMGAACAILSEVFSSLPTQGATIRLIFETLAIAGCGLFVGELVRKRRLTLEAQEKLRVLVETSPAAIVTIDDRGFIELANGAAAQLIAPRDGRLVGHPIAAFLPDLHHAVRREAGPQFRASMQCLGHRDNGESFTADIWFSTYYNDRAAPKLAAIIGEVSDDGTGQGSTGVAVDRLERAPLNSREIGVLRFLIQGMTNKEIGARMGISESTVKNIFQQLFAKLRVRSRSQLVRAALEQYRDLL
ncbi:MAG TPA: LuxR C-terminal-related transcriptional regulator [Bryobacteraceae bacterium]|jgi:DNA-binding CsgD family transcriptional regulator